MRHFALLYSRSFPNKTIIQFGKSYQIICDWIRTIYKRMGVSKAVELEEFDMCSMDQLITYWTKIIYKNLNSLIPSNDFKSYCGIYIHYVLLISYTPVHDTLLHTVTKQLSEFKTLHVIYYVNYLI